ncbi:CHAD domain-containing protein [Jatrophihabitans endophyticus]|uniref:CHAD domain-containing protein n=1 Tax=Jatrophihabitans endophyticus TaxID=1206085 RepID=A0A1M5D6J8_9ACTN|nr:CHAD domain-containing protein [Jatrophihabitans endophyticus]SHF62497.1 CHAD domain-containing protein [Jatrophihabitans endophyticus]
MTGTADEARVLDVPLDWTMPKLGKRIVPPGGSVETASGHDTVTTHDTADGDLAAAGVSLRRSAGTDATWTLTVGGASSEFPAEGRGVPAALRELLLGVRAGGALRSAGRTTAERTVHRVLSADGVEVGTITDVRSTDVRSGAARDGGSGAELAERRHVEVAGWDGPFLDTAVARLVRAGAVERRDVPPAPGQTVGDVVRAFLAEQRTAIVLADLGLRRGEDAIHPFRVAIRRVRSALRVVTIAEAEPRELLDTELQWLSALLGAVRDAQVLRDHLDETHAELARRESLDLAGTVDLLDGALRADEAAARAALTKAMTGRRYLALLRTLRQWTTNPAFTSVADAPRARLARYVRAGAKDLDRRLARAGDSPHRLHGARKAAKRVRYVVAFVDEAGGAAGKHAARIEKRARKLQARLGVHQDSVVAADFVARTAATARGQAAFGCGVVWAYEQERATAALRRAVDLAG